MTPDEQERIKLGWDIIAYKVAYYMPEAVHPSRVGDYVIHDDLYDAIELRYLELCRKLGELNTVVHKTTQDNEDLIGPHSMMEVDVTRPSVQLVMAKLARPK